jgi:hypothetical protein
MIDDHALHFVLIGVGLGVGSFIKTFWDKLAEHFWDKEWKDFRKWKASVKEN